MASTPTTIGIDVTKAQLELAARPSGEAWHVPNDESGISHLVERLRALRPEHVRACCWCMPSSQREPIL